MKKFLITILCTICFLNLAVAKRSNPEKLNFIFLIADDMNDWILQKDKYPYIHTPNLDKLASQSISYTNAYANAPLCNPSRASILTGKLPSSLGIYAFPKNYDVHKALKSIQNITLPKKLSENGYLSLGVGKVFHYDYKQKKFFNKYKSLSFRKDAKKFFGSYRTVDYGAVENEEILADELKADWAIQQLQEENIGPFFMAVGFNYPHLPWAVPQKYLDMIPLDQINLDHIDESGLDEVSADIVEFHQKEILKYEQFKPNMKEAIQAYFGAIAHLDDQVGRILEALENSPYADNTVIVFTSDHGYHLGEKGLLGKRTLWERSNHIPLFIKVPGKESNTNDELVSLVDLYPTFLALAGIEIQDGLDGHDLFDENRGSQNDENSNTQFGTVISTFGQNRHSVRIDDWRYISYRNADFELYDLKNDPEEKENLFKDPNYILEPSYFDKFLPKINKPGINSKKKKKKNAK